MRFLLLVAVLPILSSAPHWTQSTTSHVLGESQAARGRSLPQFQVVDRALTYSNSNWSQMPNCGTHAQETLTSHAGWEYLGYWDEDRNLALARRQLPSRDWEVLLFLDYQGLVDDSHNQVCIGIAPGDGTIHLSFDHHVDDLNYRVSVPGLASAPGMHAWDASSFGPVIDVLDPAKGTLTEVTYPTFVTTPDGGILFAYRERVSGNGDTHLVDYDATTSSWSNDRVLLSRLIPHIDPLGGSSNTRNAYLNRLDFDSESTLHATWTWREAASPTRYNRDIAYAYSTDGGLVWRNGAGAVVADTSAGEVIDIETPGIRGVELGAEWGLMNNQGQTVDSRGRVHMVMYRKDVPDTVVSYGNNWNSHYVHDWRDADGTWHSFRLPTMGGRPKLFADDDDNLVLVYRRAGKLTIDVATPDANWEDWARAYEFDADFASETQLDHRLLPHGVLAVALQRRPSAIGLPSQIGVVELPLDWAAPAAPHAVLVATADAYARGGVHASTNYGSLDKHVLKDDASDNFDREAFLRFELATLVGQGPIERAVFVLRGRGRGELAATTPYFVHAVVDDAWDEALLDWTNRPSMQPGTTAHYGRDDMRWDVTELVQSEVSGDTTLTLGLTAGLEGSQRALNAWSREAGNEDFRPRLEVIFAR